MAMVLFQGASNVRSIEDQIEVQTCNRMGSNTHGDAKYFH
jgi:hypothetical protein